MWFPWQTEKERTCRLDNCSVNCSDASHDIPYMSYPVYEVNMALCHQVAVSLEEKPRGGKTKGV